MAYKYNIKIDQGATYTLRFRLTAPTLNFVGATGRGKLRARFTDAAAAADFTVTPGSDADGIYFDAVLSDTVTAAIPLTGAGPDRRPERFAYDLEVILASGTVLRVLEGIAEVSPEATK